MVVLTDGNLHDPKEFAKLLSTLECSPQRFPIIHLGVIGQSYEVESIAKELRSAIVSLSRQDVTVRLLCLHVLRARASLRVCNGDRPITLFTGLTCTGVFARGGLRVFATLIKLKQYIINF